MEKVIRDWRVRSEGPGYVVYFDPSCEHVVLYDGGLEVAGGTVRDVRPVRPELHQLSLSNE